MFASKLRRAPLSRLAPVAAHHGLTATYVERGGATGQSLRGPHALLRMRFSRTPHYPLRMRLGERGTRSPGYLASLQPHVINVQQPCGVRARLGALIGRSRSQILKFHQILGQFGVFARVGRPRCPARPRRRKPRVVFVGPHPGGPRTTRDHARLREIAPVGPAQCFRRYGGADSLDVLTRAC